MFWQSDKPWYESAAMPSTAQVEAASRALEAATAALLAELQAAPKRQPYQDRTGTAVINSIGQ